MVKEKSKSDRRVDHDGYKKRASAVCVRNEFENEVLLISSSKNKTNWVIPGGGIEDNENAEDAAEREVYEEAGVKGRLGRLLGVFENKEKMHRTAVYLLIVDKELDEWEENTKNGRLRKWFSLCDAKYELERHKPFQGCYLNLLKGYETLSKTSYINYNHFNSLTLPFNTQKSTGTDSSISSSSSPTSTSSSFNSSPVSTLSITNFINN
ncbi:unnamed protein product [Brachionus calyciflorus]|uniref:diphosphoinositol-polyphosphate diphosphatase n=1 Tax=Brachionus calyciflorus TaxID=104777 RepID=A0A813VXM6_9BILA|nr:unnamed protein product [Brachionus calyciflorus]